MAVTRKELESEIAKVLKRLDKIDRRLDTQRKQLGLIIGLIKDLE